MERDKDLKSKKPAKDEHSVDLQVKMSILSHLGMAGNPFLAFPEPNDDPDHNQNRTDCS